METFNKILHSYAIYCRKKTVKIFKCYLIPKKVMTHCPRMQFFLANPVQYKLRVVFGLNLPWFESMEWNVEENLKRLLPKVRIYAYAQKNTDMPIKNTHMRVKFLLSLVCFILFFTEHAYLRMRIFACIFLRLTKNKIRTRYAYFSGIYKEIFLWRTS